MSTAGDRIFLTRGDRQHRVSNRIDLGQFPRPLSHERPGAVVNESDIRVAGDVAQGGVALVAGAGDRIEAFLTHPHLARSDILVPRDDLRLKHLDDVPTRG